MRTMHDVVIEYFQTGALLFFPLDARMVRVNETAAALLRTMLAGRADEDITAELRTRHGLGPREAHEMIGFLRDQLARFGLDWEHARRSATGTG